MYPLRGNQDPAPRLHSCLLAPPLSLHTLLSLSSNCSNLSFGTQRRSWRLESIPYKQEMGDTERLLCPGAAQGPARFHLCLASFPLHGVFIHVVACARTSFLFFLKINLFYFYLFLAALDHRYCARAFSSCGEWGLLFVVVRGLLITVTSLVVAHGLQ